MSREWTWFDGDERLDFAWDEDGRMVRRHTSPGEDGIMAQNAAIRSAGGTRPAEWFQPILSMSMAQWCWLHKEYPVLKYGTEAEKTAKWLEISRNPEYRKLQLEDH